VRHGQQAPAGSKALSPGQRLGSTLRRQPICSTFAMSGLLVWWSGGLPPETIDGVLSAGSTSLRRLW
jgi:hypothetical protein